MSSTGPSSGICLPQWVRARLCCEAAVREDIQAEVFTQMAAVPASWEAVVEGRGVFWSRGYREILETSLPTELLPFYVLLHVNGVPAVAYAAQMLLVSNELLALRERTHHQARQRSAFFDTVGRWLRNRALGLLGRRVLVLGNLFSCGPHGGCAAPGFSDGLPWELLPEALAALRKVASAPDFLIVKDMDEHSRGLVSGLTRGGFSQIPLEPSMELCCAPAWRSHDDYLAVLNTKYRKAAARVYESVAASGIVVEPVVELAPWADRLHALYLQVEARAQTRFGVLTPAYLPRLADSLGPDAFRCTLLRRGGELLGFSMTIKDGDTAIAHIVGFDYAENQSTPIYLRLLHGIIEDGLALGCSRVHYGRTALEPKARLGAKPVATEIWLRHTNPLINLAVAPLMALVSQDTAPAREPFRNASL